MLAAVLAAVRDATGPELSGTFSRFVSVRSSFEGVMLAACSVDAISAVGGVFGVSEDSTFGTGGGKPCITPSKG